jgi:hypothetical protein
VAVCVVVIAVGAHSDQGSTKPEWKAFDNFDDKNNGIPFFQEMKTETTQTMKVQGMEVIQTQTQAFLVKWTPKSKEKDKNIWTVEFEIVGVKMNIEIGGNNIKYDSTSTDPLPENPLTQFFKTLIGAKFTYTIEKDEKEGMKVTKVTGVPGFVGKLAAANEQLKGLLESILSEEALKQMATPIFAAYPRTDKEWQEGKWSNTALMNMGPIGTYTTVYTYAKSDKENTIGVTGTMSYKPPETKDAAGLPFVIKEGSTLKAENIKGTVTLDPKLGCIKESDITMDLKGLLKIDIAGVDTSVDLTQKQSSTMKTSDKLPEGWAVTPAKK